MSDLHSAIEAMFPSTPAPAPAVVAPPIVEQPPSDAAPADTAGESATAEPEAAEAAATPAVDAVPQKSASDYAIELSKMKRRAERETEKLRAKQPSADALARLEQLEAAKSDPLKALQLLGIDYKTLTDRFVESVEADPAAHDPSTQKLAAIEAKIAAYEQQMESERQSTMLRQFDSDVREAVKAAADAEYLHAMGDDGVDFVAALIRTEAQQTGKFLPYREATRLAEAHFEQQAEALSKTKKLRSKLGTQTQEKEPTSISATHTARASHVEKPRERKSTEDRLTDAINEFYGA